jgi:hypothetical protein
MTRLLLVVYTHMRMESNVVRSRIPEHVDLKSFSTRRDHDRDVYQYYGYWRRSRAHQ